ncbi:MAG: methyltransferase domain-containing protein [bacterium]
MPNPSNASAASSDRHAVATDLYIAGGASDASSRCDINSTLGALDLGDEILARLKLQPGETVLDIACGAGQHLERYRDAVGPTGTAKGFDFNPDAIAKVVARGLDAAVAPAWDLPIESGSVDALTCNYAIYYFDDIPKTLAEWARVLKPGGRLLITGPADDNNAALYGFHKTATGHSPSDADVMALGFVSGQVTPVLDRAGFTLVSEDKLTNPITFPDIDSYLDYWVATSLFRRTPGATREQGFECLTVAPRPLVINKRVTVVLATKA